jgi:hypothetical protein
MVLLILHFARVAAATATAFVLRSMILLILHFTRIAFATAAGLTTGHLATRVSFLVGVSGGVLREAGRRYCGCNCEQNSQRKFFSRYHCSSPV